MPSTAVTEDTVQLYCRPVTLSNPCTHLKPSRRVAVTPASTGCLHTCNVLRTCARLWEGKLPAVLEVGAGVEGVVEIGAMMSWQVSMCSHHVQHGGWR